MVSVSLTWGCEVCFAWKSAYPKLGGICQKGLRWRMGERRKIGFQRWKKKLSGWSFTIRRWKWTCWCERCRWRNRCYYVSERCMFHSIALIINRLKQRWSVKLVMGKTPSTGVKLRWNGPFLIVRDKRRWWCFTRDVDSLRKGRFTFCCPRGTWRV